MKSVSYFVQTLARQFVVGVKLLDIVAQTCPFVISKVRAPESRNLVYIYIHEKHAAQVIATFLFSIINVHYIFSNILGRLILIRVHTCADKEAGVLRRQPSRFIKTSPTHWLINDPGRKVEYMYYYEMCLLFPDDNFYYFCALMENCVLDHPYNRYMMRGYSIPSLACYDARKTLAYGAEN